MNIFSVLQTIFIVLKLLELIDWNWWLVFAPTYISIGIALIVVCFMLLLDKFSVRSKKGW